jgi:glycosyltransferase 2 family protein
MKKHIYIVLGFAISIILLYFALKGVHFSEIWSTLRKTSLALAFTPLIFIGLAISICSFRWSRVAGTTVRFKEAFVALLIGMFVNNVLPARLGEVARGYVLSRKKKLSLTYSLSTVLLDRFFDLTGLLLITLIFFPRASLPPTVSKGIYFVIGVLVICVILFILLSRESFANHLSKRFLTIERPFLSRLTKRLLEVQENLKRIGSPLTILFFVVMSFCSWLSMSVALYLVIRALGISVPFACVPFVCALLNLAISIPSSPGYVGLYQFLIVYLLSIFGVSRSQGLTVSILYHASWYVPYTVVGFVFSLREHLKIRDIRKLEAGNEIP